MYRTTILALAAGIATTSYVLAGPTPSNEGARVFFTELKDGAEVTSPFVVKFGLEGMELAPAGTDKAGTGHHHLFIDRPELGKGEDGADELDANINSDEKNVHFGKAQTETTLTLTPGKHTLQLVLGDKDHIPHNTPLVSDVITVTVK